jgi:hypothetical protein
VAALVAVYPADDAGVSFVFGHHGLGEGGAGGRVVGRVPATSSNTKRLRESQAVRKCSSGG